MLILEGADNLGKTTAARRVIELCAERGLKVTYSHMSRPGDDFDYFSMYRDLVPNYGYGEVVQDRFHLGGRAYQGKISQLQMEQIVAWLRSHGCYTVVFIATPRDYTELALSSTKSEMFELQKMEEANRNFCQFSHFADKRFVVKKSAEGFEYPSDNHLNEFIESWIVRRKLAKEFWK